MPYDRSNEIYRLSKENQFFLLMIRLRRASDIQELVNLSDSLTSLLFVLFRPFSSIYPALL